LGWSRSRSSVLMPRSIERGIRCGGGLHLDPRERQNGRNSASDGGGVGVGGRLSRTMQNGARTELQKEAQIRPEAWTRIHHSARPSRASVQIRHAASALDRREQRRKLPPPRPAPAGIRLAKRPTPFLLRPSRTFPRPTERSASRAATRTARLPSSTRKRRMVGCASGNQSSEFRTRRRGRHGRGRMEEESRTPAPAANQTSDVCQRG